MAESEAPAVADEDIAEMKAILGDELAEDEIRRLLRMTGGDKEMAVTVYFDGGLPANDAVPAPADGGAHARHEAEVNAALSALVMDESEPEADSAAVETADTVDPLEQSPGAPAPRAGDALARVTYAPGEEDGAPEVRRPHRRPGTAPASRAGGEQRQQLQVKMEAMQSVLGGDVEEAVLEQLLRSCNGDVQLALEAYFDQEGQDFVFVGNGEPLTENGGHEQRPRAEARRERRQQRQRQEQEPGPRKPYQDLAELLGNGVVASLLAPVMVETQGDVPKAVEKYCERVNAEPGLVAQALKEQAESEASAEAYYLRPEKAVPVYCNVYDLAWGPEDKEGAKKKKVNSGLPGMGFGIYHSGIEVYGREVSFGFSDDGATGVFEVPPRCAGGVMPRITFKESVHMGDIYRSRYEMEHLLQRLADKYTGDSYDLVRRNCNHFSNELCVCLVGKKIPSYINRPANVGKVALNIISVPATALGRLMDGIKNRKEPRKEGAATSREGSQERLDEEAAAAVRLGPTNFQTDPPPAAAAAARGEGASGNGGGGGRRGWRTCDAGGREAPITREARGRWSEAAERFKKASEVEGGGGCC